MPDIFKGLVTKTGKMSKTITVTVTRTLEHPVLLKKMEKSTKFLVHDEGEEARLGDKVTILHGLKFSKRKAFGLMSIDHRHGHNGSVVLQHVSRKAPERITEKEE